ncbi:MAG: pyruvate dehydrogenase (acetyl-transferring), homodimeric type [Verrucomicrobiae bacterium]|nr:pyruvate dehydrogenase (acetyl-transferring), homodimeric type [Verrucomicrobiae bacterium]
MNTTTARSHRASSHAASSHPAGEPHEDNAAWIRVLEEGLARELRRQRPEQSATFLENLIDHLRRAGINAPSLTHTPYRNTIPADQQPEYPGDLQIERRIKSICRWNAMAMVVHGNKVSDGLGGHISSYASSATLYEVGYNHFFRGADVGALGDLIYFQGHTTPGNYARAFLEGRLSARHLQNFRRELAPDGGLSSYPHPYLMPDFWQFPTVSMGLGPINSLYQARYIRYLKARQLLPEGREPHVWSFIGDGESDEPESLGAIAMAGREHLDNLTWIINCNLQRLDGPVRGNGKIIQELEGLFRGAGWNVIKLIWGRDWDPLFAADHDGLLQRRMEECVDGDFQKFSVESGSYIRKHFFGKYPALKARINHLSDTQLTKMLRGGHDSRKVYAAYAAALAHSGQPTVILAKTVKGYGLGEAGEGRNISHQQKKLNEKELREFRARFEIPVSDEDIAELPFYRPPEDSPEVRYVRSRRKALGGEIPRRTPVSQTLPIPALDTFGAEALKGSGHREASTTMAFVDLLKRLLRDEGLGRHIVPIIPDEARTFGMEAMFPEFGIYSSKGQLYEPVDRKSLSYYHEATDGQILEEGITEAGSMASFIAAGTAHANLGVTTVPFYIYYSMFGFQRVGDSIWAAADSRARGFLLGATAGRTTLNGEGLQHQDGHSHLAAASVPNLLAYDPAFAYELAVIIADGLQRMYGQGEDVLYYITLYNENHPQPPMPAHAPEGILKGLYKFQPGPAGLSHRAHLLGSGPIIRSALKAQEILARYDVSADVWSATSYKLLRNEALACRRWNLLHPSEPPRRSYLETVLSPETGVFVAVSDHMKLVPDQIAPWVPGGLTSLGTDGFGRSETRDNLRRFFEIDAESTALATLAALADQGALPRTTVAQAIIDLGIDPEKPFPQLAQPTAS